nr:reverse transcriptase domain-containing protein [Tanacetum cinerariifolium]
MPAANLYYATEVTSLDTHCTPIQKQPEVLLCLVRLSWRYFLGDDVYIIFLDNDDRDMDLFNLISASNATMVKTRTRLYTANEREIPSFKGLDADSILSTPSAYDPSIATKSVSDPKPLSYANPLPHPEKDISQKVIQSFKGSATEGVTNDCRLDALDAFQDKVDYIAPSRYFSELRHLPNADFLDQYNITLALQVAMGSQLRLRFEQEVRLLKKSRSNIARRDQRVQKLDSLRAQFSDLQVSNKQLSDQMDARLDKLSVDFNEELYSHMLTPIAGHHWVIRHGLCLAVMKCVESSEIRQVFADVVSTRLAKGMSEGLKYGIEHGKAGRDLADVEIRDLRPSSSQLKILVYSEVHDPEDLWAVKEEMLLEDAITANISWAKNKNKCRVVCRTYGIGSAHHTRSDGIPVSALTVPQGLVILLADASTQTEDNSKSRGYQSYLRLKDTETLRVIQRIKGTQLASIQGIRFLVFTSWDLAYGRVREATDQALGLLKVNSVPSRLVSVSPAPDPSIHDDLSMNSVYGSCGVSITDASVYFCNRHATSRRDITCLMGWLVMTTIGCAWKYLRSLLVAQTSARTSFSLETSFIVRGDGSCKTASVLSGHDFIPSGFIMYPRNIPSATLNEYHDRLPSTDSIFEKDTPLSDRKIGAGPEVRQGNPSRGTKTGRGRNPARSILPRMVIQPSHGEEARRALYNMDEFMIVRSPSPYNDIIVRPRIKEIQAVPSTAYEMLKFRAKDRIVTIRSTILTPTDCTTIAATPKDHAKKAEIPVKHDRSTTIDCRAPTQYPRRILPCQTEKIGAGPEVRQGNPSRGAKTGRGRNPARSILPRMVIQPSHGEEARCGSGFSPYESRCGNHHFRHSLWDMLVESFCQFPMHDPNIRMHSGAPFIRLVSTLNLSMKSSMIVRRTGNASVALGNHTMTLSPTPIVTETALAV